jgi:hypothetical protein
MLAGVTTAPEASRSEGSSQPLRKIKYNQHDSEGELHLAEGDLRLQAMRGLQERGEHELALQHGVSRKLRLPPRRCSSLRLLRGSKRRWAARAAPTCTRQPQAEERTRRTQVASGTRNEKEVADLEPPASPISPRQKRFPDRSLVRRSCYRAQRLRHDRRKASLVRVRPHSLKAEDPRGLQSRHGFHTLDRDRVRQAGPVSNGA